MLLKNIIILLCCCVYSVISASNFIDKGQRAELYELLDNEVAIVKISIPDDQFIELKDSATNYEKKDFSIILLKMPKILKRYTTELQKINFNKVFPGYNFTDNLPQLQIGDDGYSKYDIKQVLSEFDYDPEHYSEGSDEIFLKHFFRKNKNFNLLEILDTLKGIEMADIDNKDEITSLFNIYDFICESPEYKQNKSSENMSYYIYYLKDKILYNLKLLKKSNFNELFPGNDINEIYPELQIGEDGYAKFNIDEVYAGFNFDLEYYEEIYLNEYESFNDEYAFDTNKDFRLKEIVDKVMDRIQTITSVEREAINNILNTNSKDISTSNLTEFKTKNATMTFELNGSIKSFKKITFSISGEYSREFPKPNYNIKIRGGQDLYGRSHFKLRSDCIEPTQLRTKLVSDIHDHLGLKSSSANYVQLYINEEYMGLYIITDLIKPSWVEQIYGDKNTANLYKCKNMFDLLPDLNKGCINENEDVTDNTEWINFLKAVENAKSASDLEDIFEIDHFLYEMAIEYLTAGWDHIQGGHNFNLYKQPNGKWIYLSYDFDLDIGIYVEKGYEFPIDQFFYESHINDILIFQDPSRFEEILNDIVNRVFNPSTLFPRIDELKQFIKPYIELDKIANSDGNYPGRINKSKDTFYSLEQWDAYSEFTTGNGNSFSYAFGLKYWILMMYRNVCNDYKMECDPVYMDENYQYPINKDVEYIEDYYHNTDTLTEYPTEYTTEYTTDTDSNWNNNLINDLFENITKGPNEIPTEDVTEDVNEVSSEIPTEDATEDVNEISSEIPTEDVNQVSSEIPTEDVTEDVNEVSSEIPTEDMTEDVTEDVNEVSSEIPTRHIISSYIEKETTYEIDEPTAASTDGESSNEEKIIDIDASTIGIDDDDESSIDEDEDTTELVESSIYLPSTVVNTSTLIRTTITKTKTKTINYKTIKN